MPLLWFRRKKSDEAAGAQHVAPVEPELEVEDIEAPEAAEEAGPEGEAAARKRRRGNRGGRGRRKPAGEGGAEAAAGETGDAPADKPAREPQQRRGRGGSGGNGNGAGSGERSGERAGGEKSERGSGERSERGGRGRSRDRERDRDPHKEAERQRRKQLQRRAPLPPAKRELLISVDVGEQRVAILEDGKVAEVYLERPERRSIAGNIYKGVVDNVLPGMEAAFIEMGLEKNGFLYVDEIVTPELEGRRHGKKIQDLIQRGEEIIVQAVKDPMKTKGARLTTEISLPGRFVVFVPYGEGLGVSRRLEDDERSRLKDIVKRIEIPTGGIIVRTAAEGASAEDIERDIVFLQRLWKTIQARAKGAPAPSLIYQEAELPLRVVRDLFTGDFEGCIVDNDQAFKRINGYLKKTSPHMVERITRYKEKAPLFEAYGVDAEIRSTLSRRVDLPSGGYLIFDYAEAFTMVDVNTGRFVGSRSKTSTQRLEDTIVKNNLEAVKEVVRQLRLRDIGGIIVIDFIDMANPKNRQAVEEALKTELERDRTKTYVVEISPLGLVEMTRQNVTDGPREILTKKCPTCGGDGIVVSETTAAVDAERRMRALAAGSKSAAFKVEVNAKVAAILIGSAALRLRDIEAATKRRFLIVGRDGIHIDHFALIQEGAIEELLPVAPVAEGSSIELKLTEIGRFDGNAGIARVGDVTYVVAEAAKLVGKKVTARVERYLDGISYATLLDPAPKRPQDPITAEGEAEKPTRQVRRKAAGDGAEAVADDAVLEAGDELLDGAAELDADADIDADAADGDGGEPELGPDGLPKKKRTRRGSRGGRGRKKKPAGEGGEGSEDGGADGEADADADGASAPAEPVDLEVAAAAADAPEVEAAAPRRPRIHVPTADVGRPATKPSSRADGTAAVEVQSALAIAPLAAPDGGALPDDPASAAADADAAGDESAEGAAVELGPDGLPKKKRTRRGSRGGRGRKKKPAGAGVDGEAEGDAVEDDDADGDVTADAVADGPATSGDLLLEAPGTELAAVAPDEVEPQADAEETAAAAPEVAEAAAVELPAIVTAPATLFEAPAEEAPAAEAAPALGEDAPEAPDAEPAPAAEAPAAAVEEPAKDAAAPVEEAPWQPVSLADIPDEAWGDGPRRGSR